MRTKFYVIAMSVLFILILALKSYSESPIEARKQLGQLNLQYSPEAFVESAANGDMLAVTLFLEAGMHIDEKHSDSGMTALIAAASRGRTEIVRTLLDKGADVAAEDEEGKTALRRAHEGNYIEVAQALLRAGAELVETVLYIAYSMEPEVFKAATLGDIAAVLAEMGNTKKANEVLEQALDSARSIKRFKGSCLYSIAKASAKAGNFNQAVDIAQSIKDEYWKAETFKDIVATSQAGKFKEAEEVLKQANDAYLMLLDNEEWEEWPAPMKVNIVTMLLEVGNIDQALEVANSINMLQFKILSLGWVATAMAKAGDVDQALNIARSFESPGDQVWALSQVAKELAKINHDQKEEEVLRQALEIASSIEEARPKALALTDVAEALIQTDNTAESKKVLKQALESAYILEEAEPKFRALTRIADVLFEADNPAESKKVLKQALETAYTLKEAESKFQALTRIAEALFKADNIAEAEEVLKQTFNFAQTTEDKSFKESTIELLVKIGNIDKALDIAQTIEPDFRRRAFLDIALQAFSLDLFDESQQAEFVKKFMDRLRNTL
jgi:ankyrin repeat protein